MVFIAITIGNINNALLVVNGSSFLFTTINIDIAVMPSLFILTFWFILLILLLKITLFQSSLSLSLSLALSLYCFNVVVDCLLPPYIMHSDIFLLSWQWLPYLLLNVYIGHLAIIYDCVLCVIVVIWSYHGQTSH